MPAKSSVAQNRTSDRDNLHWPVIDSRLRRRFNRRLLTWFHKHRRDLPWRQNRDPYHIWVSEVMLQQTQAATVVRYFEPFLKQFPTVEALAAATEQEVLRSWEGLGYYRRARDLHRAARHLAAHCKGRLPDDPALIEQLPGVGRYMTGAVLSQAYGRRLPILEANSERVLCRFFGLGRDPREGGTRRWLWQAAEALLPARNVGDFNQALMELGALVCTPAAPRCESCPVARDCAARSLGQQHQIPFRAARPTVVELDEVGVIVHRASQVLLVQRPRHGRWAGMWEFPHGAIRSKEQHETAGSRVVSELTGLRVRWGREVMTIRHAVNHNHITLACFQARYRSGRFRSDFYLQGRWVDPSELHAYPISAPQRRIAESIKSAEKRLAERPI